MEEIVIEELSSTKVEDLLTSKLIVFNDDVNSFEWVIECFVKYLQQTPEQAEQCAMLVHNRGRYAVKHGSEEDLLPFKVALDDAGLSTEIQ